MPAQESHSVSEASKLQRTNHRRALVHLVPESLKPSATDRKEDLGFARARSLVSTPKSLPVAHRLRDHRSLETLASNGSKSFEVPQSRSAAKTYDRRHSTEGGLKREARRRRTSPDRSSPTRRTTSTPQYSAPGSTRQLATFCEEERVRFLSAKSAKVEEPPEKWTAQPVPERLLGCSLVFAVVLSFFSRLLSALAHYGRKSTCPAKLDTAMNSADMLPSAPKASSPLADSGIDGTVTRKYRMRMDEFFTRASSIRPRDRPSQKDKRAAMSSIPQYPRSRFEAPAQVFTRTVSAGPLPSSSNSENRRNGNAILEENQRRCPCRTSKKPIERGVSYRHRPKPQDEPENMPLARGRSQSSESIFVRKTADASLHVVT